MLKDMLCCCNQDTTTTLRLDNPTIKSNNENSHSKYKYNSDINSNTKSKIITKNSEDDQSLKNKEFHIEFNTIVENGNKNNFTIEKSYNEKENFINYTNQSIFEKSESKKNRFPLELDLNNENSIKRALVLNKSSSFSCKKRLILQSSSQIFYNQKLDITPSGLATSLRKTKDGLVIFGFKNDDKNFTKENDYHNYDFHLNITSNLTNHENKIAFFLYYSNELFFIRNYERKVEENDENFLENKNELTNFNLKFPNNLLMKINKFHVSLLITRLLNMMLLSKSTIPIYALM